MKIDRYSLIEQTVETVIEHLNVTKRGLSHTPNFANLEDHNIVFK